MYIQNKYRRMYIPKENDPRIYDDDDFFFLLFFFSCSTQWWDAFSFPFSALDRTEHTHKKIIEKEKNNNEEKYTWWCRWPCLLVVSSLNEPWSLYSYRTMESNRKEGRKK
jgi:hypothetical protein